MGVMFNPEMMPIMELKFPILTHSLATSIQNSIVLAPCFFFLCRQTLLAIKNDNLLNQDMYASRLLVFLPALSLASTVSVLAESVLALESSEDFSSKIFEIEVKMEKIFQDLHKELLKSRLTILISY